MIIVHWSIYLLTKVRYVQDAPFQDVTRLTMGFSASCKTDSCCPQRDTKVGRVGIEILTSCAVNSNSTPQGRTRPLEAHLAPKDWWLAAAVVAVLMKTEQQSM